MLANWYVSGFQFSPSKSKKSRLILRNYDKFSQNCTLLLFSGYILAVKSISRF